MIYLDNAATSWPKPEAVYRAADRALREESGNPGRSGHALSLAARARVEEARRLLARLLGAADPSRIVFALNATDALNLAIKGTVFKALVAGKSAHAVTSAMEHNSVTRPLAALAGMGLAVTKLRAGLSRGVDPGDLEKALRPDTRLVVVNHVSNVHGAVSPIAELGAICRARGVPFLVDASQSAGSVPVDLRSLPVDMLAFPGHKGLFGPQGTGALYIAKGCEPAPAREGGTGSRSEDAAQPEDLPDRYESGTMNVPGIAALGEGARFLLETGVEKVGAHEAGLGGALVAALEGAPGLKTYPPPGGAIHNGIVSVSFEGIDPARAAMILESAFGIAARSGLHCAPDAHEGIGTLRAGGTLRISAGFFNTAEEIALCAEALREIARSAKLRPPH